MFDHEEQELLEVVNDQDEIIGQLSRKDMMSLRQRPSEYIRAVELFLQRPDGMIYLPRRSFHKKIAPGGLDHSAAGHVMKGESYKQACVREVKEELGIDISPDELVFVTKIAPSPRLFYFRIFYLLRTEKMPLLSPEHISSQWVKPEDLEALLRSDIPTKETLYEDAPLLIEYLIKEN